MSDQDKRERTRAAALANRVLRLRRMAAELRAHGWTVEEPKDGPPVRPEIPRGRH